MIQGWLLAMVEVGDPKLHGLIQGKAARPGLSDAFTGKHGFWDNIFRIHPKANLGSMLGGFRRLWKNSRRPRFHHRHGFNSWVWGWPGAANGHGAKACPPSTRPETGRPREPWAVVLLRRFMAPYLDVQVGLLVGGENTQKLGYNWADIPPKSMDI